MRITGESARRKKNKRKKEAAAQEAEAQRKEALANEYTENREEKKGGVGREEKKLKWEKETGGGCENMRRIERNRRRRGK